MMPAQKTWNPKKDGFMFYHCYLCNTTFHLPPNYKGLKYCAMCGEEYSK